MQEGKKPQRPVQGAPLPALQRPNAFQPDRMPAGGERSEGVEEGTVVVRETAGPPPRAPATFRIHNVAVLLTYSLGQPSTCVWPRFLKFVRSSRKKWSLRHWSATLEETDHGAMHAHLMIQFLDRADVPSTVFAFDGVKPNARPAWADYLGEAFSTRNPQPSFDRGFFYVWADKVGTMRMPDDTICVDGDYAPAWTGSRKKYKPQRKWAQALWEAHKLSHDVYDDLLFKTRQGVVGAKRNLDAVREHEYEQAEQAEMAAVAKRIRGNRELLRPFLQVPEAEQWLDHFQKDALRFPILLVLGPSFVGKTEWSKSLFKNPLELKVGTLQHFPEKMREFHRGVHDGVVLDDVRDLDFLAQHQHVLQGKYDTRVEFATTPGGQCVYRRWLYRVPFVATVNYSTANLGYLRTHDWLKKKENCVLVEFQQPPVEPPQGLAQLPVSAHQVPPEEAMRSWMVADVKTFLSSRDLLGLADICYANGVNGEDLLCFQSSAVAEELRLTPFQAKKLMGARAAFLAGEVGDGRSGR